MTQIDFRTEPALYRHWKLEFHGPVAHLIMQVDPDGGLYPGYELKLNTYDLGVDIELADAITRLRFEHPEIGAVVLRSGRDNVFSAGANIRMLAGASHGHKVNFCKFTNETRCGIEDASQNSGQFYLAAINGPAAGGGYELAVACDHVMLIDDRRSAVSLPETPLLAVLPGTGGLTRVTDKRRVRRDRADIFCSTEEGIRGRRAVEWRLVDEAIPPSAWDASVAERATGFAARTDRPRDARGVALPRLERTDSGDTIRWSTVTVELDRAGRCATITVAGPDGPPPGRLDDARQAGFWPLRMARELDDAILHLRLNEPALGLWTLCTRGAPEGVLAHDGFLETHAADWFIREVRLLLKRTLKRLDVTARSLIALIAPGSCFAGTLAELAFAADRAVMFSGAGTTIALSALNFGAYPMANDLSRLRARFWGEPASVEVARARLGEAIGADAAEAMGLVTLAYDETDWDDEIRIMLEERASFSPDALTGMEANLRFVGPETMETRIFGRLTAWQNWIFQRPNAVGEKGALKVYGKGEKAVFDWNRV